MPVHEVYQNGVCISRTETNATVEDVKAEAQRRIIALCGASDLQGAIIKQLNSTDPDLAKRIDAIRAASNVIETSPPVEVQLDPRWPD